MTSPREIEEVLSALVGKITQPSPSLAEDGAAVYEYRIFRIDGSTERRILPIRDNLK
ncbi:hypothetical protein [Moorena sp. SIO3H5]|uniref:hypothetical protein n=1 Tax=Moorena sp. SIO3H5 TaxID=2607834 RepID=UPI0013B739E9|nr:hypothetical protein [Moorena sp. SIO3H5]NEO68188.1 hypothetical protein [Moorena sp. SIO3H5]